MARVKRAVNAKKRRRTLQERTKGYYGTSSRTLRGMKEQSRHSMQYQYRDRRNKKRDIRKLWITRINAAARLNGLSYSIARSSPRSPTRTRPPSPSWPRSPRRPSPSRARRDLHHRMT